MKTLINLLALTLMLFTTNCSDQTNNQALGNHASNQEVQIGETHSILKTDLQNLGLKGRVKVLKQEEFYILDNGSGIGDKTGSDSYSYKFNEMGNKIEEQNYDSVGMIKDRSDYIYSIEGMKMEKHTKDLDNNPIRSRTFEHNEIGQIIKTNGTDFKGNDTFEYYSTSKYDENGNEILIETYTPSGQKVASGEYTYVNNKKIKVSLKDNLDTPYSICEYQYNDKDEISKEMFYTGNQMPFEEYTNEYVYDSQNNWIKKVYILSKKLMKTSGNANRNPGVQTIALRTITYY
jgi:hypothetical protein